MKGIVTTIMIITSLNVYSQEISKSTDYYDNIIDGIYKIKSTSDKYSSEKVIIPRNSFVNLSKEIQYLYLDSSEIFLFKNSNPSGPSDVAGVLSRNSLVEVLRKDYRAIYKDPNSDWFISFEVWKEIKINDNIYFTDYKLHRYMFFKKYITKFNQLVTIFAEAGGYDYYYDQGYPENFCVVVFDSNNEIVFESGDIKVFYGGEFWDPDYSIETKEKEDGTTEIYFKGFDEESYKRKVLKEKVYSYIWNGTTLKKINAR